MCTCISLYYHIIHFKTSILILLYTFLYNSNKRWNVVDADHKAVESILYLYIISLLMLLSLPNDTDTQDFPTIKFCTRLAICFLFFKLSIWEKIFFRDTESLESVAFHSYHNVHNIGGACYHRSKEKHPWK